MARFAAIARELTALSGLKCAPAPERSVAGGSINECYAWRCGSQLLFVKVGARDARAAFELESLDLAELLRVRALRVPRVIARGETDTAAFLALEWIESKAPDEACEARLGEGLAALHSVSASRFGLHYDNLIGRTPQRNGWSSDWAEFFRDRRLRPQLTLAAQSGHGALLSTPGARLLEHVPALLAGHHPSASLLHGDLWGGNWLASSQGEPVVFDPAVYYGDREADVAMTRLFGGFGARFYRAYSAAAPLAPGWQARGDLYNLYHVLNHANLFGGGYAHQARAMMERLLA
jgi:protein-ribulosamine 3-kinase